MIGKYWLFNGKWERIELTPEETWKILDNLLDFNADILAKCERKAKDIKEFSQIPFIEIVKMLYEKSAIASYTIMLNRLDQKIADMKKPQKEPEKKSDSLVEKAFSNQHDF
jgi:hypothetical protein